MYFAGCVWASAGMIDRTYTILAQIDIIRTSGLIRERGSASAEHQDRQRVGLQPHDQQAEAHVGKVKNALDKSDYSW